MTESERPDWGDIRADWSAGRGGGPAALAALWSVNRKTLHSRAAREGWGRFGFGQAPPAPKRALRLNREPPAAPARQTADALDRARALYDACDRALRAAVADLERDPDDEAPKDARSRAELIRAHCKALFALIEAIQAVDARAAPPKETAHAASAPALDLAAARREIVGRLDRLAAAAAPSVSESDQSANSGESAASV